LGARCLESHLRHPGNVTAALGASGTLTQRIRPICPASSSVEWKQRGGYRGNYTKAEYQEPHSEWHGAREGYLGLARDDQIVLDRENVGNLIGPQAGEILVSLVSTTPSSVRLPFFTTI